MTVESYATNMLIATALDGPLSLIIPTKLSMQPSISRKTASILEVFGVCSMQFRRFPRRY
jgi:hypothetical protein